MRIGDAPHQEIAVVRDLAAQPALGPQPTAGAGDLPAITEPPGVAFLDVTHPGPQPSLPLDATVPEPLPATVALPRVASIELPPANLLAALLEGYR